MECFEQCIACRIEAIYILLRESDLLKQQDPNSFDKLKDMIISRVNGILGHIINTHHMVISTPDEFVALVVQSMSTTWGPHHKSFIFREINLLADQLNHIFIAAPWL